MTTSRLVPTQFPFEFLTDDAGASADPVLVEIVQGSLAAVEMEVETAIGRTSRSPMIRDAHDFRAGIHDRNLRKLTGRSYSALVHPVARDFPLEEMVHGDVFFHNVAHQQSVYLLSWDSHFFSISTISVSSPAYPMRSSYTSCQVRRLPPLWWRHLK